MPQDLPVDREVMRVSATDLDDGENATVRYNLSAKTMGDEEYFRIDSETGIIFLKKAIDVSKARGAPLKERALNSRSSLPFIAFPRRN